MRSSLWFVLCVVACDGDPGAPSVSCETDRECQDGDLCNGAERCRGGVCKSGAPAQCPSVGGWSCTACAEDERCVVSAVSTADVCTPTCLAPPLPVFTTLPTMARFLVPPGVTAVVDDTTVGEDGLHFSSAGRVHVQATWSASDECARVWSATIDIVDTIETAPEQAADAVSADDPRIAAWAEGYRDYRPGTDLDLAWSDPNKALGPALGAWDDALSLGNGGQITMVFSAAIVDGPGADLAVFENGFSEAFLELAFVEVSSNGVDFARFPAFSRQEASVGPYGTLDPAEVLGVAGRFRAGHGQAFDLAVLATTTEVQTGRVDLGGIHFVRVVDIIGDGTMSDVFGQPIYDPTPTYGPAGFDLEAIGALHVRPSTVSGVF